MSLALAALAKWVGLARVAAQNEVELSLLQLGLLERSLLSLKESVCGGAVV